jgi:prophage antirepressor-like protein
MSETPRTDAVKYHARGQFQDVAAADFARELERENSRLRECNRACAEWVKQSANQWMHRPRGGWPIELRKAYEAVHDSALPNQR